MKTDFRQILSELEGELMAMEARIPNLLERFKTGAQLSDQAVAQLKHLIPQHFSSTFDEIYFFKHIQPHILAKKIYYSQLFRIEADRPKSIRDDYRKFLDQELQRISMFFEVHNALFLYFRGGATARDEQYFLRNSTYNNEYPVDLDGMLDTHVCTVTSFKLAELIALEDVSKYLITKLENMYALPRNLQYKPRLQWTESKTDLVELGYALHLNGSFNNGSADIKQIFEWLENSLDVDFGNVYSNFRDIRMRKKEMASFLTKLKDGLLKRIEEMD